MARGPRITYPHAIFHVLNRFVDKHPFFSKDRDYHDFLDAYFDTAKTFGIWTYAYDLVPNHFHIVLETPTGEISRFLQRFLTTAVQKLNAVHGRTGHLLQGRTKTLVVEKDRYFETVVGYVLLNRVRAGLARTVLSDPYNSAREMITRGKTRIARGPLWSYLFGHEFNSRRIDHEITLCRQWLNSLDADHNADEFEAGHHGSFLSSAQYRSTTLEHLERRQLEMGTKTRRKTDRHKKEWTWDEIIKACDNVLKKGQWRNAWMNLETATKHLSWYVAFTAAGIPYEAIREHEADAGVSHSRYAMAIRGVRRSVHKRRIAEQAIQLALKLTK